MIIKIENLSKLYKLGVVSSKSLSQDLNKFWAKVRRKEDPYLKIYENNLNLYGDSYKAGQFIWALKDVNFDIEQGDVIGIIGKNGAGKSTLLKILSRVTSPTKGNVKIKGKIASLLEVGTGFHQELTGRENIYLNGSILGMKKKEIDGKIDEVIDFAGVEKFIDTPVKRYSSGMYVRLAFSVAAHLDPDILIVDEVLAVGDLEFQKKSLKKLNDVSQNEKRTVLFVSHNLGSIKRLCTKSILMEKGQIKNSGTTEEIISQYLGNDNLSGRAEAEFEDKKQSIYFKKIFITQGNSETPVSKIDVTKPFTVKFLVNIENNFPGLCVGFSIYTGGGLKLFYNAHRIEKTGNEKYKLLEAEIPGMFITPGTYFINASLLIENAQLFDYKENVLGFEVIESGSDLEKLNGRDIGVVMTRLKWNESSDVKS